uniref:Variant surface glycoprotein 640 n=1 Tax=Trypanosoma brucei TaxID=5691 RepID=M4T0J1_9TRYP|nr:variant surface glycoprotein 640 [Trypanosoma brucei]
MRLWLQGITVAVLLLEHTAMQTAKAVDENKDAFQALCAMYSLVKNKVRREHLSKATLPGEPVEIENLMLVTLHRSNYTNATYGDWGKEQQWSERKKQFEGDKAKSPNGEYIIKEDSETKAAGHLRLSKLLQVARRAHKDAKRLDTELTQAVTDINNNLNAALFGDNTSDDSDENIFDTRTNACVKGGAKVGQSIASDMACLCSGTSAADVCCKTCGDANYNSGGTAASVAKTSYGITKAICEKVKLTTQPTAAGLAAAVQAVLQQIGNKQTNTAGYQRLGGGATAVACDRTSDTNTACVDYSTILGAGGAEQIPWVNKVLTAIKTLQKAESDSKELTILASKLEQLNHQAWTTYDLIPREDVTATSVKSQQLPSLESVCHAAKDNQKACENLKDKECVFNTETKKCELKKDVKEKLEKENQETGGKDKKTGTTNTTGSNSFLINKAPLLLAFLLF